MTLSDQSKYTIACKALLASIALCTNQTGSAQNYLPRPFIESSSREITVSDLLWSDANQLPINLRKSKAVREWMKNLGDSRINWIAPIDIDDSSQTTEFLIASSYGGSGGRNFLLVGSEKKGPWRELAAFLGAPVFVREKPKNPPNLQVYYRNGDMWVLNYVYSHGKYNIHSSLIIPEVFVTECFYRRWQQLNLFISAPGLDEALKKCFQ